MSCHVVQHLLGAVLDIRLTLSNDDSGVKNLAAELISKIVKHTYSSDRAVNNEENLFHLILIELEKTVQSHLGFYIEETFQLLVALSTLNKDLIENLVPSIELTIKEIEIKRGIDACEEGIFQKRLKDLKKRLA